MLLGMATLQHQINPNTVRYRRFNERQKSGVVVLSIEVSEERWAHVLKHCGLLDSNKADDRKAMAEALSQYLALSLIKTEEDLFR